MCDLSGHLESKISFVVGDVVDLSLEASLPMPTDRLLAITTGSVAAQYVNHGKHGKRGLEEPSFVIKIWAGMYRSGDAYLQ